MADTEATDPFLAPAWWLRNRGIWMAAICGCDPGWLAIDATEVAFATDRGLVFRWPRSHTRARVRLMEQLALVGPGGVHRFHLQRPRGHPQPGESAAAEVNSVLVEAADAFGAAPGGASVSPDDLASDLTAIVDGIGEMRTARRNARRIVELLGTAPREPRG